MILTYFYTISELSIKSLKEGTITPSLAKYGMKPKNGHEKNTKGLNRDERGAKFNFGPKLRVK
jgi:hypothetical protein